MQMLTRLSPCFTLHVPLLPNARSGRCQVVRFFCSTVCFSHTVNHGAVELQHGTHCRILLGIARCDHREEISLVSSLPFLRQRSIDSGYNHQLLETCLPKRHVRHGCLHLVQQLVQFLDIFSGSQVLGLLRCPSHSMSTRRWDRHGSQGTQLGPTYGPCCFLGRTGRRFPHRAPSVASGSTGWRTPSRASCVPWASISPGILCASECMHERRQRQLHRLASPLPERHKKITGQP